MSELFLRILNMSIAASWLALVVMVLRLLLKKAPRWTVFFLWALVAVRLVLPISLESRFSLVPARVSSGSMISDWTDDYVGETQFIHDNAENADDYQTAVDAGREPVSAGEDGHYVVTGADRREEPSTVKNTVVPVFAWIWAAGVIVMGMYAVLSYLRLRKRVRTAVRLRNNIYECDQISTPFVLGIVRPRIYLPFRMAEADRVSVIAHEQTHIRRRDHWLKPFGFLLLSVYWFNPILWIVYILFCRDIELACDERVIREMDADERADYSQALLNCSAPHRMIAACPLAFGEVGVKERVKNVLTYQKPAFWIILVAVLACAVAAVCFLTNPKETDEIKETYETKETAEESLGGWYYSSEDGFATIRLKEDGSFVFERDIAANYAPIGTWSVEDDILTLASSEKEKYLFRIKGEELIYQSDTGISGIVEEGTIFFKWKEIENGDEAEVNYAPSFWDRRPMIYVNGKRYLDTGKAMPVEIDESEILGTVTSTVESWDCPAEEGQTNFGQIGAKYAYCEDGLAVLLSEEWYYFEPELPGENPDVTGSEQEFQIWTKTLDEAIYSAIIKYNQNEAVIAGRVIPTASWKELARSESGRSGEEPELVTVYGAAMYQEFEEKDGKLVNLGGNHIPVRMELKRKEGGMRLISYWTPGEGAYYKPSIENVFPKETWTSALRIQDYAWKQLESCYDNAVNYMKTVRNPEFDPESRIAELFEEMQSSPAASSDPDVYINEHEDAWREILHYGDYTLNYCFDRFEEGGQTGLTGYLMARACENILSAHGEAAGNGYEWENGQEWYDLSYQGKMREAN